MNKLIFDAFVITNFVDISKKGNKFCDHKVNAKKMKMFPSFEQREF